MTMNWITSDLRALVQTPVAEIALVIVALVCGAIIGADRERREKPAGLKTLILVSLGSAGFTMASFVFTSSTGDSGRVAAQIVTGIGFLGAGVVWHGRGTVTGITTAATIWATASVGMIVGAGYPVAGLGMSILIRFVLTAILIFEKRLTSRLPGAVVALDFDPDAGRTRVRLERILVDYHVLPSEAEWKTLPDGMAQLNLQVHLPRHHLRQMLDDLVCIPEVKRVDEQR